MQYRIIAITNPNSSNASKVEKRLIKLEKKLSNPIERIESLKDSAKFCSQLSKQLATYSDKPTVVLIGGGDGTVHDVVSSAIKNPKADSGNIILLPIWGGNANDFAYMLNGLGLNKDLYKLINKASKVKVHPLEITQNNKTDYAICYASFGASAYAADVIDKEGSARKGKFSNFGLFLIVDELARVAGALLKAPTFKAHVNGKRVEIFEQVFTNGSRIAKVDRLPVNLTDKAFYRVAQPSKHPIMLLRILKILTGNQVGEVTAKPSTFEVKEPVLGQFDGEVITIPKDTKVTVSLSDSYIYALSTKLD